MARSGRGWRGMLALGVVATAVAVPAGAAGCSVEGAIRTGADKWTRIAGPSFAAGGDTMTSYAVDEFRPDRLFATNGIGISATTDGGCTWAEATLPPEPLNVPDPLGGESSRVGQRHIVDVHLPFVAASTVWAYGMTDVVLGGTPLVEPRVLLSVDGGRSFALRNGNLPRFARPVALSTDVSPLRAYLLLDETVPTENRTLWVTNDGGTTWSYVSDADVDDFAVDIFRRVIWGWGESGLLVSSDSGATWGTYPVPSPPLRVDVAPMFTSVALSDGTRLDFAGGRVFTASVPTHVTSVAAGPELGLAATSSVAAGVMVDPPLAAQSKPIDMTPFDVTLSDLAFAQRKENDAFTLFGFSPRALYRRPVTQDFTQPPRAEVVVKPPVLPPPPKAGLRPYQPVVTLKPGEKRRISYDLVLPPRPTPLDVYFMTDSTGSMRDAIAAVQEGVQDIVDDLTKAGIDLHFGVADFRDWPQAPDGATYPYKRHREVGPINDDLGDALESITTGGGNGDDSALEAMYQAVTGEGRKGLHTSIPGGQGAEFRDAALKVVLVASDEEMREPKISEPWNAGPTKAQVIDALVKTNVEMVGIRVRSSGPGDPRPQMEEIAEAVGSVAPPGGIDCDGDGETDLDAGDALVCDFASGGDIAAAFIGMLRGIKDIADVHVGVDGPRDVVRHLGDPTFEGIDVKAANALPVPVEYRCTPTRYGTDTPVTIEGVLRSRSLVAQSVTVRCLAPAIPPAVVVPPVLPRDPPKPLRAVAAPPPPPPQPVQNVNTNPNPNPNPQAQANAGMASQEDQQHQLALAENDVTEDEELAFSGLDNRNDVAPAATLVVGALVACAAAGAQLHLARRVRAATNPSRGDRR